MKALFLFVCSIALAQDFDLLIRNGRIVDGTGAPWHAGDIGIKNGRIVEMGRIGGKTAVRTIDAKGLVVAPDYRRASPRLPGKRQRRGPGARDCVVPVSLPVTRAHAMPWWSKEA